MEDMEDENNENEIVINLEEDDSIKESEHKHKKSKRPKKQNAKKKLTKKKKILIVLGIFLAIILMLGIVFGVYVFKAGGNVTDAVLNIATDIVGEKDPIFVLILGVSDDISVELTDTIMLCAYNPKTQKAYMLSIPRDTFVGKNESWANGYDKINAQYQTSAEKTVECVELLTGVNIDYYVIVRNISITSIFECIGSVDFDVPIDMNYDDPTQDLHIHLKAGYQTLKPNQIEQLLRFRHNNNGTSYPSSYGDNDYGRMKTQREFLKTVMDQVISLQNASKLKDLAAMVYTNLQTNMSGYTVLEYVPYALKFSTSNLRSEQLPGSSAMINELWFYRASKSQTKTLMDELMVYLELDDKILDSHYKYASSIKGVKPDENWVSNEVIEDDYVPTTIKNKTNTNTVVDSTTCDHQYAVYYSTDATCTSSGTVVYKCIICSKEYTTTTNSLGHSYSNGICTRCGALQNPQTQTSTNICADGHTYEIVNTTQAFCTSSGTETKRCVVCGDTVTTTTSSALGHNYSNGFCIRCKEKDPNYVAPSNSSTPSKPSTPLNSSTPSAPSTPSTPSISQNHSVSTNTEIKDPETPVNPPAQETPLEPSQENGKTEESKNDENAVEGTENVDDIISE